MRRGRHDNPDDQPTHQMYRMDHPSQAGATGQPGGTLYYGRRQSLRLRLTDPFGELEQLPSTYRIGAAWVLLMATAEMNVLGRHVAGQPWLDRMVGLLVQAPLHAAVAAGLLVLLGRLAHTTARLFGGSGEARTTTEIVVLFAAVMAVPAGIALLLWGQKTEVITTIELILSVIALLLGIRLLARITALDTSRAAAALILPGVVVMVVIVILTIAQTMILPDSLRF